MTSKNSLSHYYFTVTIMMSVVSWNTLREDIFVEEIYVKEIFAEFNFAILPQNCNIKFHKFFQIGANCKYKFCEISIKLFNRKKNSFLTRVLKNFNKICFLAFLLRCFSNTLVCVKLKNYLKNYWLLCLS